MMRVLPVIALALALAVAGPAVAQVKCGEDLPPIDRDADSRLSAQDFVRDVTAKEAAFAKALGNFGYTVEASVQTLTGDTVDGEFRQVATLGFDEKGPRRQVTDSVNTLQRIKFAERDIDALRDAFILTPDRIATGDIVYSGRQRTGQFNASLFDILPRDAAGEIRGFQGRVWVRARENAVMRLCGRSALAPIAPLRVEMVRAPVAEQYWFPVLIRADEDAKVGDATVHVRVTIKYSNYTAR